MTDTPDSPSTQEPRTQLLSVADIVGKGNSLSKRILRPIVNYFINHSIVKRCNDTYRNCMHLKGHHFARLSLKDMGINYQILNPQQLSQLPEGAFITVSNHPYGGIDGIMLVDIVGHIRPTYKVMVNQFLMRIESLATSFIAVIPFTGKKNAKNSTEGFIRTIRHLKNNHPMGFFPAGAVSFYKNAKEVEDREWQPTIMRLIMKAKVPVVPIFFHDKNSSLFYLIGKYLGWQIRTFFLPRELYNKAGKTQRISIGTIIPPSTLDAFTDETELASFLKAQTYKLREQH